MNNTVNRADRLSNTRAIAAVVLAAVMMATQGQRMDDGGGGPLSWAITGITTIVFLVWASGVFRGTALRTVLNDESSDANRKRSLTLAFWTMMVTAIVCYALTYIKDYGPRDAIQVIVIVGISTALLSFGVMERRQAHS